jgi:hypothetical protein
MENNNNIALLKKAETMSDGGKLEKILAINLLMDHFRTLPREKSQELLMKLAKKNQPTDIRFHISVKLLKENNTDKHTTELLVDALWNG